MENVAPPPMKFTSWPGLVVVTLFAAGSRVAGFGRLGLDHFDEGVYASAGLWSLAPGGLAGLDPGLIPYAPPGYPILVGLAYRLFGPSDLAAIAVSILAGIAATPATYRLGRKTFGPPTGVAAAGFAAASMPHIVFSRMALTDATFLLAWLVAMTAGGDFLERPGPGRAVFLGLAVGVAQLVKYNGWLAGAIVAASACLGPLVSPDERSRGRLGRVFGWGVLAAVVAASVYAPWFRFVERHGGYASLLNHQRGYFDGPRSWPANWLIQLRQLVAFTDMGLAEAALGPTLALVGLAACHVFERRRLRGPTSAVLGLALILMILTRASSTWWLGLGLAAFSVRNRRPRVRLLGVWWVALSILTPMYHPYARLWLPLEAAGWLMGGLAVNMVVGMSDRPDGWPGLAWFGSRRTFFLAVALGLIAAWIVPGLIPPRAKPLPGKFDEPRDSLRLATMRAVSSLPPEARSVLLLGRPPLAFYATPMLARRGVTSGRVGSSDDVMTSSDGSWAIVDSVALRQEGDPGGEGTATGSLGGRGGGPHDPLQADAPRRRHGRGDRRPLRAGRVVAPPPAEARAGPVGRAILSFTPPWRVATIPPRSDSGDAGRHPQWPRSSPSPTRRGASARRRRRSTSPPGSPRRASRRW